MLHYLPVKLAFIILLLFLNSRGRAQNLTQRLQDAILHLQQDTQLKHSTIALYVINGNTGEKVFDKNSETGLAPASCQKIITSVTAFELLGKQYIYKTKLGYTGIIQDGLLRGNVWIMGSGDPTLGSWRYPITSDEAILTSFQKACKTLAPAGIQGTIHTNEWGLQSIPDGWIWQDIGNYYGAGAFAVNWRENQFDIILHSGQRVGDTVSITGIRPTGIYPLTFTNEITSAAEGSGDNGYIYIQPKVYAGYLKGTIPVKQNAFPISGALPDPGKLLSLELRRRLTIAQEPGIIQVADTPLHIFYTYVSPPLDSINYWFLKKSINLYGEAMVKTIAYEKSNSSETDTGVDIIRNFWRVRGIEKASLKILDGSGLSPGNRVTPKALVSVLQYAKDKAWFPSFYYDLPLINGIKMKDGYINGVRSYSGYLNDLHGNNYIFSFIINNFDGDPVSIKEKMWKVLDLMK